MGALVYWVKTILINWRPLLSFMIPALLLGALLGIYPGYKAYEYIWVDAGFCTSCHVHDYANVAWEESSHGRLTTCHDCHHQPLHVYAMEPLILILHQPKFPKDMNHAPHVPKDLCEACHLSDPHDTSTISGPLSEEDLEHLPKVDKTKLHKVHLKQKTKLALPKYLHFEGDKMKMGEEAFEGKPNHTDEYRDITCADCHGGPYNRAHNFSAVDKACLTCHETIHKDSPITKRYGCRQCHFQDFIKQIE